MNTEYYFCPGWDCPLKDDCQRFLLAPHDAPLWWLLPVFNIDNLSCPNFDSKHFNYAPI